MERTVLGKPLQSPRVGIAGDHAVGGDPCAKKREWSFARPDLLPLTVQRVGGAALAMHVARVDLTYSPDRLS